MLSEEDVRLERLVARLREPLQSGPPAQPSHEQSTCSASQVSFYSLLGTVGLGWALCTSAGHICTVCGHSEIAASSPVNFAPWAGALHIVLHCARCQAAPAAAGDSAEAGGRSSGGLAGGAQRPPPRAEAQEQGAG